MVADCPSIAGLSVRLKRDLADLASYLDEIERAQLCDFLESLRIVDGLSPSSLKAYVERLKQFFVWAAACDLRLSAIDSRDVENFLKYLYLELSCSTATRNLALVSVRRFYQWREHQGLGKNPAAAIRGAKHSQPLPRKYSAQTLQKLIQNCDPKSLIGIRDRALLLFMLATGGRSFEVAAVALSDLQLFQQHGRVRFLGKGNKERVVSFEGEALTALRAWLSSRDANGMGARPALWLSFPKGKAPTDLTAERLQALVGRRFRAAKLPFYGAHRLRANYATALYDAGIPLREISLLMGHNSIETTQRYLAVAERTHSARIPAQHLAQITGTADERLPLWYKLRNGQ
ncbi:MAG: tyrosine-type recombinase/integrase [Thiotrichales bacterium]